MDRIERIFNKCRDENRAALVIFVSCGFPNLPTSEEAIERAIAAGADIIELGMPFSDPMADGPVICASSHTALQNGANIQNVLELAARVRSKHPEVGLVLFSYMNVIFHYGIDALCAELKRIGTDGVLAVDLPLEERGELMCACRDNGLHLVPLVSPATDRAREEQITKDATGFVYYVSVRGATGVRDALPEDLSARVEELRQISPVPVAVGFGIAGGDSARGVAQIADGVVVGSAFVKKFFGEQSMEEKLASAQALVAELSANMRKLA